MQIKRHVNDVKSGKDFIYARHASAAFNRRMHKILQDLCREIAEVLSGKLHAILLGGNYGRGEGGTRRVIEGHGSGVWSIGEAPAEDIDILIVSWFKFSGRRESINHILKKYEDIFSVPIDVFPIISPPRLMFIPQRFHWRRLIRNSLLIYGPPRIAQWLARLYKSRDRLNPMLGWSLLLDQGVRLLDVLATDQDVYRRNSHKKLVIHQGKYFREIAQVILLVSGRHHESVDLQLHEYICLMDEENPPNSQHLMLLKTLLPRALFILKSPEQAELDMPENWLFHVNLWLETFYYCKSKLAECPNFFQRNRIKSCARVMNSIVTNNGSITKSVKPRLRGLLRYLKWSRNHVFFI